MTLPFKVKFVCVSDVHVVHPEDRSGRILIKFLEDLADSPPEIFLLNGDIFDMCAGGHPYFQKKFLPVAQALKKLAERGSRIIYLQGNHEFYIEALPWGFVERVNRREYLITLSDATKIMATHGDLLSAPWLHVLFRWITNTRLVGFITKLLPGEWFDKMCLSISGTSRKKSSSYEWSLKDVLDKIMLWSSGLKTFAPHLIVGHYHYPFAHRLETKDARLATVYGLDTWWKRANALCFHPEEGFFRCFMEESPESKKIIYQKTNALNET